METGDVQSELGELKRTVGLLERRIARLEGRVAAETPVGEIPAAAPAVDAGEPSYAAHFGGLAVVSFALVGALILRIATQHGLIAPAVGTALGLAYCAALLAAPWLLGRVALVAGNAGVLQYCGAALVPLIVLESFHKTRTVGAATAALILAGAAAAGAAAATRADRRLLGMAAIALPACAIAAMGLDPDAALLRGGALALCAALVLRSSHRRGWRFARPAVLVPVMLSLGLAVIMTARREGIDAATAGGLLGCAIAVWALVCVNHIVRAKVIDTLEAAWLPVATAWALGLAIYASPLPAAAAGCACAAALLYAGTRGGATPRPAGALGAATAGALAALIALPVLDPTFLLLAAAALWLLWSARRASSVYLGALGQLLAAAAAIGTLASLAVPLDHAAGAGARLGAAAGVCALLFAHYFGAAGLTAGPLKTVRLSAPLTLVCALATTFGLLRGLAIVAFDPGKAAHLAQTLALGGLALTTLGLGRYLRQRTLSVVGLAGVALFAVRVVFWDLFSLEGAYLVVSVLWLGAASVVTSLVLRHGLPPPTPHPPDQTAP